MRRLLRGVMWCRRLPWVLTWRLRKIGPAGFVVYRRPGWYSTYPPGLRRGAGGGPTVAEAYADLKRHRDSTRRVRAVWNSPEFAAERAMLERRYHGTALGARP